MILDVKDVAYFGHFYFDVLMRMRKLKELDLLVRDELTSWHEENYYVNRLIRDFEQAREKDPRWECPRVRIVDKVTGEIKVIPGGAASLEEMEERERVLAEQTSQV